MPDSPPDRPRRHADSLPGFLWQQRRAVAPGLALAIGRILSIASFPLIFREILDRRMPAKDLPGIAMLGGLMVCLLVSHQLFSVRGASLIGRAVTRAIVRLREDILEKIQCLSFAYLDRQHTGRLLSKYAFDTQKIEGVAMPVINGFVPDSVYSLLTLAILISMNWKLAGVILLMLPVIAVMRLRYFEKLRRTNEDNRIAQEQLTGTATEAFGALRLVRSYGEEHRMGQTLRDSNDVVARSRIEMIEVGSGFGAFSWGSVQLLSLIMVAGGAMLSVRGHVSPGTVLAFVAGLPSLMQPIQMFANLSGQYFLGREAYASIRELLDEPSSEPWKGTRRLDRIQGQVVFDNVTFRYDGANRDALDRFNLRVAPGERVALVGSSGAGKSTVAGLLLGLYAPTSGDVRIDDVPLSELDVRHLRRQTAIVMQESVLLSGSIRDNIRFAQGDASDEAVRDAARRAQAEEFILAAEGGYDAKVGERGVTLSGGQRQRISIARAILRNPAVLILDEPTSALDYESERLIQQALDELVRGRTVITIAHRLSTIRNCDRVVVMDNGRVVEEGPFDQLAARGGRFTAMLAAQNTVNDDAPARAAS
ncbi:MAG TPA: ABC transporter ATP-binding protein [Tepidisphaeraceae bacterium]|jgi:ABC-type multidrug transport system fused ATPase/permease subunit